MRLEQVFSTKESLNYFERNYAGKSLREVPLHPAVEKLYSITDFSLPEGAAILEIGCSGANNLFQSFKKFNASRGVGIEPSSELVEKLNISFPELEFLAASASDLPFNANSFELVILRSVLHWMDRDRFIHAIGEALRVCKSYLLLSDFAPSRPYSVVYHHDPNCRTYKMQYRPLLEATGLVRCLASLVDSPDSDYDVIETSLYRKLDEQSAYPLLTAEDFK